MLFVTSIVLISAWLIDRWLGEPKRYHLLVGFGNIASYVERCFNKRSSSKQKVTGAGCWIFLLGTPVCLVFFFQSLLPYSINIVLDVLILYWAVGCSSLREHALAVASPLEKGDLTLARKKVSYLVSRNTEILDEKDITRATVESVLENGHDAVLASLFWYCLGGAPLVVVHRLANTLDAMWGYRSERFKLFGWFAAKADDLLGWPSAKITAVFYVLAGWFGQKQLGTSVKSFFFNMIKSFEAILRAKQQSHNYKSLNGGWVMSAGASSLNFCLGGQSKYGEKVIQSPVLGQGYLVETKDIRRSLQLVYLACWLFILSVLVTEITFWWVSYGA